MQTHAGVYATHSKSTSSGKPEFGQRAVTERKLNNWVAVAEIISAVAVVLSLIYVGLEVRRSTLESDADIQAELLSDTVQRST